MIRENNWIAKVIGQKFIDGANSKKVMKFSGLQII